MPVVSPDRIAAALTATEPGDALLALAHQLRDEGFSQADLEKAYDLFRAEHASDPDGTLYNAILDTMDFIVGWCSPSMKVFPHR